MAADKRADPPHPITLLGPVAVAAGIFLPFVQGNAGGFGRVAPSLVETEEWRAVAVLFAALVAAPALYHGSRPLAFATAAIATIVVGFTANDLLGWPGGLLRAGGPPDTMQHSLSDLQQMLRQMVDLQPGLGLWVLVGGCALTLGASLLRLPRK